MPSAVEGRVLVAPDDGPLEPSPTWQRLDAPSADIPDQLIAGYDFKSGKQTFLSQVDGGTATVYISDHRKALFDPRNGSSDFNALDGKQILLQLYDPVIGVWEEQFRGVIDVAGYVINPDTNAQGVPINAAVTLNCVDAFNYAAGFGLTPGLAGDRPPSPSADNGVWYAQTAGEIHDRIVQILADMGIDSTRYVVFSGNVAGQTVKYDPDEPGLNALRDCADAEFPFVANLYVDRFGRIVFHGRYASFQPFDVSGATTTDRWDFQYFLLGDGVAVRDDSNRVQMRVLEFDEGRSNIINVAVAYAQGTPPNKMLDQIYADVASIDAYGHYAAPPMSDLLTAKPINDNLNGHPDWDRYDETFHYAKLLVENQKDPRPAITALQIKTVQPFDSRAAKVWHALTRSDVADMVNMKVGYAPGGTGFTGSSPDDDHYIIGREMRVRPFENSSRFSELPGYDWVELDLQTIPAVWVMDTHNIFPAWGGGL
jgi:hypothetical protein